MTEYKTLAELADENGFPFTAANEDKIVFIVAGIAPNGSAVGWLEESEGEAVLIKVLREVEVDE